MRERGCGSGSIGGASALAAVAMLAFGSGLAGAQTPPPSQGQPQVTCQTIGATTYCQDGTRFDQTQAASPTAAAAADGKPAVQNIGKSGPTEYQRDDLRVFGVDDRLRRLGEKNQNVTGQQGGPSTYSGRNCGKFSTSVICD